MQKDKVIIRDDGDDDDEVFDDGDGVDDDNENVTMLMLAAQFQPRHSNDHEEGDAFSIRHCTTRQGDTVRVSAATIALADIVLPSAFVRALVPPVPPL